MESALVRRAWAARDVHLRQTLPALRLALPGLRWLVLRALRELRLLAE